MISPPSDYYFSMDKEEKRARQRAYSKRYHENNPGKAAARQKKYRENHREKVAANKKKYHDSLWERIQVILGKECTICGKEYHRAAMEVHHIVPELKSKGGGSAALYRRLLKPENKKEVETCLMLCANCHKTLHALENEKKIKTSAVSICA